MRMAGHDMAGMEPGPPTNQGFTYFVPFQAAIIQAAAARMIPTDENGPGATEAGVVYFIDRQLGQADDGLPRQGIPAAGPTWPASRPRATSLP